MHAYYYTQRQRIRQTQYSRVHKQWLILICVRADPGSQTLCGITEENYDGKQNMPTSQRGQQEHDESSLSSLNLEKFEEILKNKDSKATREFTLDIP